MSHNPGKSQPSTTPSSGGRIAVVEALRGLAALSVAWFHFTHGNPSFLDDGLLKSSGTHGWVGVEVFFVISGFVVPFAMFRARYELSALPRFLAKRLVRLEPPYLACVLLSVAAAFASSWVPGFRGQAPVLDPTQLALHVGYLVGFTDYAWLNPVFWSLAIEFQFYLTIALVFPWVAHKRASVRLSAVLALFALSLLPVPDSFLLPYLGLFALGMLTFHYRVGWLSAKAYFFLLALVAVGLIPSTTALIAFAGVSSAIAIAFIHGKGYRWLTWLGAISYSLYLVHVPIGGRVINLGERFEVGPVGQVGVLVAAVAISIAVAALYHRGLEQPAQRWSSRIRYDAGRSSASTLATPTGATP